MKIRIRIKKNDEEVETYSSLKTKRILSILERANFLEAYVCVTYAKGIFNDGTYTNCTDLKKAITLFTSKELVDYVNKNYFVSNTTNPTLKK